MEIRKIPLNTELRKIRIPPELFFDGIMDPLYQRIQQGRPFSLVLNFLHIDLWKQSNHYNVRNWKPLHIPPPCKVSTNQRAGIAGAKV